MQTWWYSGKFAFPLLRPFGVSEAPTNTHLRKAEGSISFNLPSESKTALDWSDCEAATSFVASRYTAEAVSPSPTMIVNRCFCIAILLLNDFRYKSLQDCCAYFDFRTG